ncbi:hypothetical protein [Pseudomonas sp. DE0010]|uniref:hypothetical protein n=1 Tax=Pseudomonas sp. DE0010 TaxID=2584951 RepID=UPI002113B427|nr:hypothetical protein [Pseudomonas sp. DE0010]
MNDLPYAIPCAEAKNQYGAKFYRCTWYNVPRNITQWSEQQQRNITFSNHISGKCVRGTCRASNGSGIYGMYGQDLSFSLSIYYYIYESEDGYPIAYRMDGGPAKKGKGVTYAQARTALQNFLLDHGISNTSAGDSIAAYSLDANATSDESVDDETQIDEKPMTKPTRTIEVKEAWCNPRSDDDCTINGQKVPKAQLKEYLPEIYEIEVLNAGGYCEHPICYNKDDKPVGIH